MATVTVNSDRRIENAVYRYVHCALCFKSEMKPKIAVGITANNDIQIWCENHDVNVALYEISDDEE